MKKFLLKSAIMLVLTNIFFVSCKVDNLEELDTPQLEESSVQLKSEQTIVSQKEEIAAFNKSLNNSSARNGATAPENIVQIAVKSPFLKSLVAAVVKTGLAPTLSSASLNATVFAPTNNAFAQLPAPFNSASNIAAITKPEQIEVLKSILLYHVLGKEVKKANISAGKSNVTTLKPAGTSLDNVIYLSNQVGLLAINGGSLIVATDIDASNGVIHVINKVLQFPTQNIAQIATANSGLSTLVAALVKTNLAGVFTGAGNFTVFAPTNSAFAHLPAPFNNATNINSITNKAQIDALSNILRYHVLDNRNFALDLGSLKHFTTLANAPNNTIIANRGFNFGFVKGDQNRSFAGITPANILATNGVIHVINSVLLPK